MRSNPGARYSVISALLRADGFWAYQLAVVADDAAQGITHIVARSRFAGVHAAPVVWLQRALDTPEPHYGASAAVW